MTHLQTTVNALELNATATISKLYNDLLWYVFRKNAVMEGREEETWTSALHTLRHSSQVCSKWRRLILSSSSLWSQVINVGLLRKQEWREEVMRRTGDSLLSVVGDTWGIRDIEEAVISLLDDYWPRIQFLDLEFSGPNWRLFEDQIWHIFRRPAYFLETLKFSLPEVEYIDNLPTSIFSPATFVVFDNQAPSLCTFQAPNIRFHLGASWLSHIRHLSLSMVPLSVNEVLHALSNMPLIESLQDSTNVVAKADMTVPLPQVEVPSLKMIYIAASSEISSYRDLLAHIKPAPSCCLSFFAWPDLHDSQTLVVAPEILRMYSRYPEFANATEIHIDLCATRFEFDARLPFHGTFHFQLIVKEGLSIDSVDAFLTIWPSFALHTLKKLILVIRDFHVPSFSKFVGFISSVPSIEVLDASESVIQWLVNLPRKIMALAFPALQTIKFTYNERVNLTMKAFLKRRIVMGKPIQSLYISANQRNELDIKDFKEFTRLKVITLRF